MIKRIFLIPGLLILYCCSPGKVKHSGLNDLVVGVDQIVLYENGKFYLELGLGGTRGKYELKNDTITFHYNSKPSNTWPDKMAMNDGYFESLKSDSLNIKIRRQQ